jgi:uncharacterized protein with HEPN domain
MRDAVAFIMQETANCDLSTYLADRKLRQAVERNFEIMGEAARRLREDDPEKAALIPDLPEIISFRNVLAHGYDVIRDDRVWTINTDLVPPLHERLTDLLPD